MTRLNLAFHPGTVLLCLILFLLVIFGFRAADSFWLDEYWSLYHAGGVDALTIPGVWNRIAAIDPWQTPGYFMLLNIWGALTGWSEFTTRLLSLFAGMLAVAWMYRLARDIISPFGGLAAAILLGTSAYFIYFTHEVRSYSLNVLLTIITLWAYHRVRYKSGSYAVLFVACVALLYSHYFAGVGVVAIGIYHLLTFREARQRWWPITFTLIAAGIAFLPWITVLLNGVNVAADQRAVRGTFAMSAPQAVEGILYLFSNGSIALLGILLLLALGKARFAWIWTLSVAAFLLIANERLRVILEVRYLLTLWPGLALLAAFGLQPLVHHHKRLPVAVLAVWSVAGIWNTFAPASAVSLHNPHWHLPWNTLVHELTPRVEKGDSLVFLLPDWTWTVYHSDTSRYYLRNLPIRYRLMERPQNIGEELYDEQGRQATISARRLWLAYTPDQPHRHLSRFETLLASRQLARCAVITDTDELRLDLYGSVDDDDRAGTIEFLPDGGTITRVPVVQPPSTVDDELVLLDGWRIDDGVPAHTYSVALHMVDQNDTIVAQADYGLPPESLSCNRQIIDTSALPAGEYTLLLAVYAWETGERVPVENALEDGRVQVGTIQVRH
jgi:uncharacterized membrane protein